MFRIVKWNLLDNDQKREILLKEGITIIGGLGVLIFLWVTSSWLAGIIGGVSLWAMTRFW